jgi:hypothetical protein
MTERRFPPPLVALLGGRALTATELAYAAGVSPQTTGGHLGKLSALRLVVLMIGLRTSLGRFLSSIAASCFKARRGLLDR